MSAFWIVGIGINVVMLGALVWWGVRNWHRDDSRRGRRDGG